MEDSYASYLLRLWKSPGEERPTWRASLECARTGQQRYYTLEGLLTFLETSFGPAEANAAGEKGSGKPLAPPDPR